MICLSAILFHDSTLIVPSPHFFVVHLLSWRVSMWCTRDRFKFPLQRTYQNRDSDL